MPAEALPLWNDEARTWKLWKAALKRAGKGGVYASLAPILLTLLSTRIADRDHTVLDKSRSMPPTERKRVVIAAINELRLGESGPAADQVCSGPADFTLGVTGTTSSVLGACVALIEAMCAPRNFEQHVYGCLIHLTMIDRELVEPLRQTLSRPPDSAGTA